jgi:hypothetical protein
MSYTNEESPEFIALFNGKFNPAQSRDDFTGLLTKLYNTAMSEEDTVLLQNELGALPPVISTDIVHTRKSREKMGQFGLTQEEVVKVINDSSKVKQKDTILCNGRRVNVRLVKKDEKYLVIDVYVKT